MSAVVEKLKELSAYLRPPGQGIHAVSTGRKEILEFATRYLGTNYEPDQPWVEHLKGLISLKDEDAVAILAVPSDTGAGIVRGAARGPEAIRKFWGVAPAFELGDVFCNPHFLDDEMLSSPQLARARAAMYPSLPEAESARLPVSPISITTRVYELLAELNPSLRILLLGGDHTVAWPAMAALLKGGPKANREVGILHFDAHTDLLPERLGVRYCFATWAYHANELLGRGEKLLQVGIRASGRDRGHWESDLEVRQIWASEALKMSPDRLALDVIEHFKKIGARRIYVSNDIDGTDAKWAAACGTPEPGGLTREHVLACIEALGSSEFEIFGADMVELAPGLSLDAEAARVSTETAVLYADAQLKLLRKR